MIGQISRRVFSQGRRARLFSTITGGAPSVFDSIVTLNFVDPSGARRKVPAYVGEFYFMFVMFPLELIVLLLH